MAATHDYPVAGDPIVRGDPFAIKVTINTPDPIDDWEWLAQVRSTPDAGLTFEFLIVPDEDDDHAFWLQATAEQSELLTAGMGFDLEQTAPVVRTWWICPCIHVQKDYSR